MPILFVMALRWPPNCGRIPIIWNGSVNGQAHWLITNLSPRISRCRGNIQAYVQSYLTGDAHLPEGLRTYLENL
jgi:hypothetical protein